MKTVHPLTKFFLGFSLFFFHYLTCEAQVLCKTLQPNGLNGKDAKLEELSPSANFGNLPDMVASEWTSGGVPFENKSLLRFDLSSIPAGSVIQSASLSLYANVTSNGQYPGAPMWGTNNSSYLKKVTSSWDEFSVTWNTQPNTTSSGQVLLAQSTSTTQDYLNINISNFVQDWMQSPSQNFGMMLDMIDTSYYNGMIFCSSDHTDSTKRPKLVICYIPPPANVQCITLQPDSISGEDAIIFSLHSNPIPSDPDFRATEWTNQGVPSETRGLIKFNLSSIPQGSTINSAYLSLYANLTTPVPYPGQPTYGNNNACYLKRVTSPWSESTVQWLNQPSTTSTSQVLLPQSTSTAQDYLNSDISAFAQDWVQNPSQNYGMMLDMITTNYYNSMIFCSSDHADSAKRPKLEVCFIPPSGCVVQSDFTYSLEASDPSNADTVILSNTSTSNNGFSDYSVLAYGSTGTLVFQDSTLSPYAPAKIIIPNDTVWSLCIQIKDSTGMCADTTCKTLYNLPCTIAASFTWDYGGSTLLLYNQTTSSHGPYTSIWSISGGVPAVSTTDQNPTINIPSNSDSIYVCLSVTDVQGCTSTTCSALLKTDTLCGLVFNDANGNGIFDLGESRRPNSNILIDGVNYLTDANGFYRTAVGSGMHSIFLNAPPGWSQTFPTNPLNYSIVTTAHDYVCGLDFGMKDDTLVLSGVLYVDNNGNGLYDLFDTPLANQSVNISGANTTYSPVTNSSGFYSQVVYSGVYFLSYSLPPGYVFTQPINPTNYTVTASTSGIVGLNFGIRNNSVTISGKVYVDGNGNGAYDNGESLVANQPVQIGNTLVYTNTSGVYSVSRSAGNYQITYTPSGSFVGYSSSPGSYSVNASVPGSNYGGNDFGITIPPSTGDICVDLSPLTCVSSGFPAWYHIYVYNNGNVPMQGTLYMYYDPNLVYANASPVPASANTGTQTLSWNIVSNVGQTISMAARFDYPFGLAIGTPVFNAVVFVPAQGFIDVNPACDIDTLYQASRSSWDPNNKQVSPIGSNPGGRIRADQELEYTITFQNLGNAPAVNVIVVDTLESELDISTFEMKNASHNYNLTVEGRILTWVFSNIMLPDSASDFAGSMGFVSFKIKPVSALTQGVLVLNYGEIYFDFNDVVITNTEINTIDYMLSLNKFTGATATINLAPNPFSEYTTFKIDGPDAPYQLKVLDLTGKLIRNETAYRNVFTFYRETLASGLYIYEIYTNSELVGKGKLTAN